MSHLYKEQYRQESTRHRYFNYGNARSYFITICLQDRLPSLGYVQNGMMCLSELGGLIWQEWEKTPALRPDMNLSLGSFIVMPNHVHGILTIGENIYNYCDPDAVPNLNHADVIFGQDAMHCIPADRPPANHFGPQRKNLASIVRGLKAAVTVRARQIDPDFKWQARFYDHIIRDAVSYRRISEYIRNNPLCWKDDKYYC